MINTSLLVRLLAYVRMLLQPAHASDTTKRLPSFKALVQIGHAEFLRVGECGVVDEPRLRPTGSKR